MFLCAGETYYFDYSATDADGDSLAYAITTPFTCLLYTSDAADERSSVDLGGRRIIKKKNQDTLPRYDIIQHATGAPSSDTVFSVCNSVPE